MKGRDNLAQKNNAIFTETQITFTQLINCLKTLEKKEKTVLLKNLITKNLIKEQLL